MVTEAVEVERFQCSPGAGAMWSRLLALYRLRRYDGDSQIQGHNWAETAFCSPTGSHSDLGTEARLLFIASVGILARLEEHGGNAAIGAVLARRRLARQRTTDVRRRHGLTYDVAEEVFAATKEYLSTALGDDPYAVEVLRLEPFDNPCRWCYTGYDDSNTPQGAIR